VTATWQMLQVLGVTTLLVIFVIGCCGLHAYDRDSTDLGGKTGCDTGWLAGVWARRFSRLEDEHDTKMPSARTANDASGYGRGYARAAAAAVWLLAAGAIMILLVADLQLEPPTGPTPVTYNDAGWQLRRSFDLGLGGGSGGGGGGDNGDGDGGYGNSGGRSRFQALWVAHALLCCVFLLRPLCHLLAGLCLPRSLSLAAVASAAIKTPTANLIENEWAEQGREYASERGGHGFHLVAMVQCSTGKLCTRGKQKSNTQPTASASGSGTHTNGDMALTLQSAHARDEPYASPSLPSSTPTHASIQRLSLGAADEAHSPRLHLRSDETPAISYSHAFGYDDREGTVEDKRPPPSTMAANRWRRRADALVLKDAPAAERAAVLVEILKTLGIPCRQLVGYSGRGRAPGIARVFVALRAPRPPTNASELRGLSNLPDDNDAGAIDAFGSHAPPMLIHASVVRKHAMCALHKALREPGVAKRHRPNLTQAERSATWLWLSAVPVSEGLLRATIAFPFARVDGTRAATTVWLPREVLRAALSEGLLRDGASDAGCTVLLEHMLQEAGAPLSELAEREILARGPGGAPSAWLLHSLSQWNALRSAISGGDARSAWPAVALSDTTALQALSLPLGWEALRINGAEKVTKQQPTLLVPQPFGDGGSTGDGAPSLDAKASAVNSSLLFFRRKQLGLSQWYHPLTAYSMRLGEALRTPDSSAGFKSSGILFNLRSLPRAGAILGALWTPPLDELRGYLGAGAAQTVAMSGRFVGQLLPIAALGFVVELARALDGQGVGGFLYLSATLSMSVLLPLWAMATAVDCEAYAGYLAQRWASSSAGLRGQPKPTFAQALAAAICEGGGDGELGAKLPPYNELVRSDSPRKTKTRLERPTSHPGAVASDVVSAQQTSANRSVWLPVMLGGCLLGAVLAAYALVSGWLRQRAESQEHGDTRFEVLRQYALPFLRAMIIGLLDSTFAGLLRAFGPEGQQRRARRREVLKADVEASADADDEGAGACGVVGAGERGGREGNGGDEREAGLLLGFHCANAFSTLAFQAFLVPLLPASARLGARASKEVFARELNAAVLSFSAAVAFRQWAADLQASHGTSLAAALGDAAIAAGGSPAAIAARERAKLQQRPAARAACDGRVLVVDASADAALWHALHAILNGSNGKGVAPASGEQVGVFLGPHLLELLDSPRENAASDANDAASSADPLCTALMSVTKRAPLSLLSAPLPPGAGASSSSSSGVTRSVGVLELRPTDDAVHDVGDGHALRVDVELATHDAPSARAAAGDGVLRAAHTRAGRLLWQRRAADAALRVDVAAHLALATVESLNSRGSGSDEAFYILTHFGYVALFGAAVPALPLLLLAHVLLGARAAATCALVFTQRAAPMGTDWLGGAHVRALRWLAVLSPLSTIALLLLSTPTLECFVAPADMLLAGVLPPADADMPWAVYGLCPAASRLSLVVVLLAVEHMLILARYACPCRTLFGHA